MVTSIANPLQSLIQSASKQESSGEAGRYQQRQQAQATSAVVILADVSSSMNEPAGGKKKIDILREALSHQWPSVRYGHLIAFSSLVATIDSPANLPNPSGSTALHLAIEAARSFRPRRTLIISDGHPDDKDAALIAADGLTGRIDVIYCGPEGDEKAINFLNRLARRTGGRCYATPPANLLNPITQLLLTA